MALSSKKLNVPSLLAGVASMLIVVGHVIAIFIGEKAYAFMDAQELAVKAASGNYVYPMVVTLIVSFAFFVFGLYGFAQAGLIKPLFKQLKMMRIISLIYLLRGLALIYFLYQICLTSNSGYFKEFWFSTTSFVIGALYFLGYSKAKKELKNAAD